MPGQNNMYGSQDDPFGYGQQQAYWQQQRAADAAKSLTPATKPLPIKQTMPTQPQVQPQPTPQGPPTYQSPYGRGYVPPPWESQQIPNPNAAQVPVPPSQLPQWAVQPMPPNGGTWNPPTQPMPNPIWNGPLPSKQPLPDDIYGFSQLYGKPIPEGQKWADVRPDRAYPAVQPQQSWAIPQWYTARLQQQR